MASRSRAVALVLLAVTLVAEPAFAELARGASRPASRLGLLSPGLESAASLGAPVIESTAVGGAPAAGGALFARRKGAAPAAKRSSEASPALSSERARILLRSLTVPGWGQVSTGHRRAAAVFALAELGVWTSFTAFRVQEQLRRNSYEHTARLFAGIDLSRRDEEFRRIVGAFISSDEYNLLVVSRDAANLYLSDPDHYDIAAYRDYIARHSLSGANTWSWQSEDFFRRYRSQRKDAQRAALRANGALALAIANRLVSALHAARSAGRPVPERSMSFECVPVAPVGAPGMAPVAFRAGVRVRF